MSDHDDHDRSDRRAGYQPPTTHHHITVSLSDDLTGLLRQGIAQILREIRTMSGTMQTELDNLATTVAANTDVTASGNLLINGFTARLDAAVAAAIAAGATPQQMASVRALSDTIKANSDSLSASIVANTPAEP